MKIPNKIKIGGKTYEVLIQNLRKETGSGDMSMVQPAHQKIWVSNEMHQEQQEGYFLHEILEVIDFEYNLKMEHQTLQTIAEVLYQTLKDNNLLK